MRQVVTTLLALLAIPSSRVSSFLHTLNLNLVTEANWKYPECQVNTEVGSCVFALACAFSGGRHLGVCRDRFYFGSCCHLDRHSGLEPSPPQPTSTTSRPRPRPPVAAVVAEEEEDNEVETDQSLQCGMRSPISNLHRQRPFLPNNSHRHARIVGGHPTTYGAWPWQVNLKLRYTDIYSEHRCGAVLLNSNWIATAAHCVDGFSKQDLLLAFGDHHRNADTEPLPVIEQVADQIHVHPDFDDYTYENDVALIHVAKPVAFSSAIQPVCLPDPNADIVTGTMGFATGWGVEVEDGVKPNILQEVLLPIHKFKKCNELFMKAQLDEALTDVFICAGFPEGGKDACEGDSGGPLVIKSRKTKRWTLVGLVSWGRGCGHPNQPGVYTNVAKFRDWIDSLIGKI